MSYVELVPELSGTKKLVLSLWFRVPQASVDQAKLDYEAWRTVGGARRPLTGIIPLVIFGEPRVSRGLNFDPTFPVGSYPRTCRYAWDNAICGWSVVRFGSPPHEACDEGGPYGALKWTFGGADTPIDPSHIGIDCSGDVPKLSISILMPSDNLATYGGTLSQVDSFTQSGPVNSYGSYFPILPCVGPVGHHEGRDADDPPVPCIGVLPFNAITNTFVWKGTAQFRIGRMPETFRTLKMLGGAALDVSDPTRGDNGKVITTDHWHHLLFSFDLSSAVETKGRLIPNTSPDDTVPDTEGERTTKTGRFFIALDDENLTQRTLSAFWPGKYGDKNAVLTVGGFYTANNVNGQGALPAFDDCFGNLISNVDIADLPEYKLTPESFELDRVGLPVTSHFDYAVKQVEMGEFQLFLDASLNTGSASNRRAFITKEGRPAQMSLAEDLMGKEPEMKLHGRGNWKKARSTGSLYDGVTDGDAVGTINDYKPDPNLYGDQG